MEQLAAFDTWMDMSDSRKLCRKVMNKILQRYLKAGLAAAWESWREFMTGMDEETRRELVVERCMKRLMHLAVFKTFGRWADVTQTKKENRHKMQKVAGRWQRMEQLAAFDTWIDMADSRKLCRKVMNKILQRYLKAGLAAAWESWREFMTGMDEETRRELVVQRCMKRMTQLASAKCFGCWADVTQTKKETGTRWRKSPGGGSIWNCWLCTTRGSIWPTAVNCAGK